MLECECISVCMRCVGVGGWVGEWVCIRVLDCTLLTACHFYQSSVDACDYSSVPLTGLMKVVLAKSV